MESLKWWPRLFAGFYNLVSLFVFSLMSSILKLLHDLKQFIMSLELEPCLKFYAEQKST